VKLLTVQFSSNPCYLLLLRPKDLPQHHIPEHIESMLFHQCKGPSFTPIYVVASKCFRNQFISENTKQYNHLSYTSFKIVPLRNYLLLPATVEMLETFHEAIL